MTVQMVVAVLLVLQLSLGMATVPVIGVATSNGAFALNNAQVNGNGTLFDGTTVETRAASGQLQLNDGTTLALAPASRGTVYRDRLVLERGTSELRSMAAYGLEAQTLRIVPDGKGSVSRVRVNSAKQFQVAAIHGSFRVLNRDGLLVATLSEGSALAFESPAAGASAASSVTGCLVKKDDHYLIKDETAGVVFELKGSELPANAGHKVEARGSQIPGAKPMGGASQVMQVTSIKSLAKQCSAGPAIAGGAAAGGAAAGGAAAGGAAAGGAAAGAGAVAASQAVIAGVVVAAAATGAAVAVAAADDGPTVSR